MLLESVTVSDKGQISIPKRMREDLRISRGSQLVIFEERGRLVIEKASTVARKLHLLSRSESLATTLASERALAKDWENDEDERWNRV